MTNIREPQERACPMYIGTQNLWAEPKIGVILQPVCLWFKAGDMAHREYMKAIMRMIDNSSLLVDEAPEIRCASSTVSAFGNADIRRWRQNAVKGDWGSGLKESERKRREEGGRQVHEKAGTAVMGRMASAS